jgi:hypothetical protein
VVAAGASVALLATRPALRTPAASHTGGRALRHVADSSGDGVRGAVGSFRDGAGWIAERRRDLVLDHAGEDLWREGGAGQHIGPVDVDERDAVAALGVTLPTVPAGLTGLIPLAPERSRWRGGSLGSSGWLSPDSVQVMPTGRTQRDVRPVCLSGSHECVSMGSVTTDFEADLSPGELALLQDAETDDVSFVWVLIDLGLRENPPSSPDWRPGSSEIESAFRALERLQSRGLIDVGRLEYVDGGPPGRVTPLRHVAEPLAAVRQRVEAEIASARRPDDWEFSCWVVATRTT